MMVRTSSSSCFVALLAAHAVAFVPRSRHPEGPRARAGRSFAAPPPDDGRAPPPPPGDDAPSLADRLRDAGLGEDWAAWAEDPTNRKMAEARARERARSRARERERRGRVYSVAPSARARARVAV